MTDAHCHVSCGDPSVRELLVGRDFFGIHPWEAIGEVDGQDPLAALEGRLAAAPGAGVGEIGLDRLRVRTVPPAMRELFAAQLALAARHARAVVLHGAKCWGEVVKACVPFADRIPAFLFHGFSRSDGLIPDIVRLNGFISVGPAVLNDHAVNYRALVRKIPADRLLVETDRTAENAGACPPVAAVAAKLAELRGLAPAALEALVDANAARFMRFALLVLVALGTVLPSGALTFHRSFRTRDVGIGGGSAVSVPVDAKIDRAIDEGRAREAERTKVLIGRVTRVIDGRTLRLVTGGGSLATVRLEGVEWPEDAQRRAAMAAALKKLVQGRNVRVEFRARDDDGLVTGRVTCGKTVVNATVRQP